MKRGGWKYSNKVKGRLLGEGVWVVGDGGPKKGGQEQNDTCLYHFSITGYGVCWGSGRGRGFVCAGNHRDLEADWDWELFEGWNAERDRN